MKIPSKTAAGIVALVFVAAMGIAQDQANAKQANAEHANADQVDASANARPLTAGELATIYGGKTWLWSDGAAFLGQDRNFVAWSGAGEEVTLGKGRWIVTDSGLMCLKGDWYAHGHTSNALTCFAHQWEGDTIFQQRIPGGSWYAFKSSTPSHKDELSKLRQGDVVSSRIAEIRKAVE